MFIGTACLVILCGCIIHFIGQTSSTGLILRKFNR